MNYRYQDELSTADAKAPGKQLQIAKEHYQREIALQCQPLMNNGQLTLEDVAKVLNISRKGVG